MEIGWFTFADVPPGDLLAPARRLPALIEEVVLADEVGLDIFGLGEHHHPGFGAPAPAVVLAAAASRTSRIRLASAVTVLSTDDPVRVFEQFSALDLVSSGRAEIMVGRGALLDSFRLFGPSLGDYDTAFEEKLGLLMQLRTGQPVNWSGAFRQSLTDETIVPRPVQSRLPVWLAVGGTPSSAVRAAQFDLPLVLGTIGGSAQDFAPLVSLYREANRQMGNPELPVAVTLHGFVADTSQKAEEVYFPADSELFSMVGAGRVTAADIARKNGPGSMYAVGSPQQVIEKLLHHHQVFNHQRTMLQLAVGSVDHLEVMRAVELLGTVVAPAVRSATTPRTDDHPGVSSVSAPTGLDSTGLVPGREPIDDAR